MITHIHVSYHHKLHSYRSSSPCLHVNFIQNTVINSMQYLLLKYNLVKHISYKCIFGRLNCDGLQKNIMHKEGLAFSSVCQSIILQLNLVCTSYDRVVNVSHSCLVCSYCLQALCCKVSIYKSWHEEIKKMVAHTVNSSCFQTWPNCSGVKKNIYIFFYA